MQEDQTGMQMTDSDQVPANSASYKLNKKQKAVCSKIESKQKLSAKKRRLRDKFIEKEIRKMKGKELMEKLSSSHFSHSSLLSSSKQFGSKQSLKQSLKLALLQERAGIPQMTDPDVNLYVPHIIQEVTSTQLKSCDEELLDDAKLESQISSEAIDAPFPEEGIVTRAFGNLNKENSGVSGTSTNPGEIVESDGFTSKIVSCIPSKCNTGSALKNPGAALLTRITKKRKPRCALVVGANLQKVDDSSSSDSTDIDMDAEDGYNDKANSGQMWNCDIIHGEKLPDSPKESKLEKSAAAEVKPELQTAETLERKPAFNVPVFRTAETSIARVALPVVGEEQVIMENVNQYDVVIICGSTGSGKSTQIPQFLFEAGFGDSKHPEFPGMIGVTQPRRVAAVSVANRVASEMQLGTNVVSYQIRYSNQTSTDTKIKFMTDGILMREVQEDLLLTKYSCIILDEAHERTLGTDVLIGYLSRIVALRNSGKIPNIGKLKVIIMSATLRVSDFTHESLFSSPPPVISVEGRQHQVAIHYNRITSEDYVHEAFKKVCKIHEKLPQGGILVFLTGQHEVQYLVHQLRRKFPALDRKVSASSKWENASDENIEHNSESDGETESKIFITDDCDEIDDSESDDEEEHVELLGESLDENTDTQNGDSTLAANTLLYVLPLYSMLSTSSQMKIFENPPPGHRLVVVATNIAETSLTIPNISYVVDAGKAKERCYNTETGMQNFRISWTSKASADQRAGRAGRTGPGHCYRLYSSAVFNSFFEKFSTPEILRLPIEGIVLQMKSMGIDNVLGFPFPSKPSKTGLADAEKLLRNLNALDQNGKITSIGSKMINFPISPRYSKMIVCAATEAVELVPYIIYMVAGMSVENPFIRETELEIESNDDDSSENRNSRASFFKVLQMFSGTKPSSDYLTILTAIGAYVAHSSKSKEVETFCKTHFLRLKAMEEISKLCKQLYRIANEEFNLNISFGPIKPPSQKQQNLIRQVILSGFGESIAILDETRMSGHGQYALPLYQTMWSSNEEEFVIHSSSSLFRMRPAPQWIVYDSILAKQENLSIDNEIRSNSTLVKRYLKGITVIDSTWIPKQASSQLSLGNILQQPEPKYDVKRDIVVGYTRPTYGPKLWQLPLAETEIASLLDSTTYFAKALLEGAVPISNHENQPNLFLLLAPHLLTKPTILTKSWAKTNSRVMKMLECFARKGVNSRKKLLQIWISYPSFLLEEYLLWTPETAHSCINSNWPPTNFKKLDMAQLQKLLTSKKTTRSF